GVRALDDLRAAQVERLAAGDVDDLVVARRHVEDLPVLAQRPGVGALLDRGAVGGAAVHHAQALAAVGVADLVHLRALEIAPNSDNVGPLVARAVRRLRHGSVAIGVAAVGDGAGGGLLAQSARAVLVDVDVGSQRRAQAAGTFARRHVIAGAVI